MKNDKKNTGKPTIRHVAEDAGVSVAAVSKVLRNAYGVSDKLRAKVEKSIDNLGYRPNTAARGMRGRTYSVGMLLVEMSNPFLSSVVDGAKEALRASGYQTLIGVGEAEATIERSLIDSMVDLQMDGLLLVAPRLSGDLISRYASQIPLAVIGHHENTAKNFDTVNSDDETGAYIAVNAMIKQGRRNIQMVSLPGPKHGREVFAVREKGYLRAMSEAGLDDHSRIWRIKEKPEQDDDSIASVLAQETLPDGIFCWSDIHAVELLNGASQRGIDVPGEMSIVGYDNTPVSGLPLIGLSSVEQNGRVLGQKAAEAVLSRIGGRSTAEHLLIEPELIARRSLG